MYVHVNVLYLNSKKRKETLSRGEQPLPLYPQLMEAKYGLMALRLGIGMETMGSVHRCVCMFFGICTYICTYICT